MFLLYLTLPLLSIHVENICPLIQVPDYITSERKVEEDDEMRKQPVIHLLEGSLLLIIIISTHAYGIGGYGWEKNHAASYNQATIGTSDRFVDYKQPTRGQWVAGATSESSTTHSRCSSNITDQLVDKILRVMDNVTPQWMRKCDKFLKPLLCSWMSDRF